MTAWHGTRSQQVYRLLTTLLDLSAFPATDLAAQYPQHREIELTIKEGKSVLRAGQVTLRSQLLNWCGRNSGGCSLRITWCGG